MKGLKMAEKLLDNNAKKGLSACAIKYIAVLAMLIDHIAWRFVDTSSPLGTIMHIIGRVTAPVMTYFLVEGYYHTRDVNRYILRLGIFAVLSNIPYLYMEYGILSPVSRISGDTVSFNYYQGVIYTFFLTVLALKTVHTSDMNSAEKLLTLALLCASALIGDWYFFPIVWALVFDRYRGDFKKQAGGFALSSLVMVTGYLIIKQRAPKELFQYAVLLALIPLYFYNGKRGKLLGKNGDKWFFYIFYPLHMLILGYIKYN